MGFVTELVLKSCDKKTNKHDITVGVAEKGQGNKQKGFQNNNMEDLLVLKAHISLGICSP